MQVQCEKIGCMCFLNLHTICGDGRKGGKRKCLFENGARFLAGKAVGTQNGSAEDFCVRMYIYCIFPRRMGLRD